MTQYFVKYGKAIIEKFGTDHLYRPATPYCEFGVTEDPQEAWKIKATAGRKRAEALSQVDPNFVWITDAWDFDIFWDKIWTPESVASYLSALPQDHMIMYSTAEDIWDKLYKKCNYYDKITWGFGSLHSYAGDHEWHNGHEGLEKRVKETAVEKSPNPCQGIFLLPELINCDILYWHLMTWLAWNPDRVEYEDAVLHYCKLRYGEASSKAMAHASLRFLSALPKLEPHRRLYDSPERSVGTRRLHRESQAEEEFAQGSS